MIINYRRIKSRGRHQPVGEPPKVTLLDALRERSSEANLQRATDALIAAMPVGRAVEITPDIIAAAAAGDVALLLTRPSRNQIGRFTSGVL